MKTVSEWAGQMAVGMSALIAVVRPLCIPALGAFLASVGLGFAVNVGFLRSLLIALLSLAVLSLAWSSRMHGRWWVFVLGLFAAAGVYVGRHVWFSQWLMIVSAGFLIGISVLNFRFKKICGRCEKIS